MVVLGGCLSFFAIFTVFLMTGALIGIFLLKKGATCIATVGIISEQPFLIILIENIGHSMVK